MAEGRGRVRVERCPKRVRGYVDGLVLVDSTDARYVWEGPSYPAWYFPIDDVRAELLAPSATVSRSPSRGDAEHLSIRTAAGERADAAWRYPTSPIPELRGLLRIEFAAVDHWFEEDEEVYVHPRDPYTRVDILPTSRRVQIEVDGVSVADSTHASVLFETGLPPRWYLPKPDVRLDLLTATATRSGCPYKGWAEYWDVTVGGVVHGDLAWSYRSPLPESQAIAGLVAFYDERVDVLIDGVLQERPHTKFSTRS